MRQDIRMIGVCAHKVIRQMRVSRDGMEYIIDIVAQSDKRGRFVTIFYIHREDYIHKAMIHAEDGEVSTEQAEEIIMRQVDTWITDYEDSHKYIPSWKRENKLYRCK